MSAITRNDTRAKQDEPVLPGGRPRLLVVDDDESVAITVSEVMRLDGFNVDTSMTGEDALRRISDIEYDVVLTDLHMESIDGISVLTELRKQSPLTISIVLTGFASLESAVASMRLGAYDYLIKPCIIEDLKHTVQRGLEHRRLKLAEQEARDNLEQLNRELERRVVQRTAELQQVNEELSSANHAKDTFFAILSHELRTPLSPILGWARILRSAASDPKLLAQGLDAIERNARLQTRLIDDLLDVSRIVSGKLQVDLEPVDLCAAVESAVEMVRQQAIARDVELVVELPGCPVIVQGAPVRLQQIVWNLVSNGIKFTEPGGRVRLELDNHEGEARVVVTDTGKGIAPEFLPQVFEPFRQADDSISREHGGLGLGLAIVRRLIELHGGRVWAESEGVGKGARFIFAMPTTTGTSRESGEQPRTKTGELAGIKILVVEDSIDMRDLLAVYLTARGCKVLTAATAGEALEIAPIERPEVIICDIGLPDLGGCELIEELRRMPGLSRTPTIALSGYAMEEDRSRAFAAGFSAHVAKPVDPEKLLILIRQLKT